MMPNGQNVAAMGLARTMLKRERTMETTKQTQPSRLRRLYCWLANHGKHPYVLDFGPTHLTQVCTDCGFRRPGWTEMGIESGTSPRTDPQPQRVRVRHGAHTPTHPVRAARLG